MSVNKVILLGNVGGDPEIRYFDNGNCQATLSLATTKKGFTTKSGKEIEEVTTWHKVIFYNRMAEVVNEYVKKGSRLYVEGEIRHRKYEDTDGNNRYVTEIVASEMKMISSKKNNSSSKDQVEDYSDDLPY